jgi:hypothetical protein
MNRDSIIVPLLMVLVMALVAVAVIMVLIKMLRGARKVVAVGTQMLAAGNAQYEQDLRAVFAGMSEVNVQAAGGTGSQWLVTGAWHGRRFTWRHFWVGGGGMGDMWYELICHIPKTALAFAVSPRVLALHPVEILLHRGGPLEDGIMAGSAGFNEAFEVRTAQPEAVQAVFDAAACAELERLHRCELTLDGEGFRLRKQGSLPERSQLDAAVALLDGLATRIMAP